MNNCKILINEQLNLLNIEFKGKYINNIVLKDTIFKPENIIQIDDYIRFMFNDNTLKLPTAKLMISGSIQPDLLYNRDYTDSDFTQLQTGYYYPLRITCNKDDYSYKITEKWREETLHSFPEKHPFFYELLIMRLDNGEIWILTEDYEFRLIKYSTKLEREDFMLYKYFPKGCKNVTIMGSEREMGHRFIHDYIQSFRNLETILIDRLNSECPELVSLIRNFRRILSQEFTKYSEYYNFNRMDLIMKLVSVETKERLKLSKFAKVDKRGRKIGKLRLIELEKEGFYDIEKRAQSIYDILTADSFNKNYIFNIDRIKSLLFYNTEFADKNFILISILYDKIKLLPNPSLSQNIESALYHNLKIRIKRSFEEDMQVNNQQFINIASISDIFVMIIAHLVSNKYITIKFDKLREEISRSSENIRKMIIILMNDVSIVLSSDIFRDRLYSGDSSRIQIYRNFIDLVIDLIIIYMTEISTDVSVIRFNVLFCGLMNMIFHFYTLYEIGSESKESCEMWNYIKNSLLLRLSEINVPDDIYNLMDNWLEDR